MNSIPNNEFFSYVEQEINEGKEVKITVKGSSMRPFFVSEKDYVVLAKKERLHRGDIVLFRFLDSYRLHRIIHIWGTLLYIRGDGCYSSFERATISDVVAVVIRGTYHKGHPFEASSFKWRLKSKLWTLSYFFRNILFKAYQQWKRFILHL